MEKQKEIRRFRFKLKLTFKERLKLLFGTLPPPEFGFEVIHKQAEYKGGKDEVFINKNQFGATNQFTVSEETSQRWKPDNTIFFHKKEGTQCNLICTAKVLTSVPLKEGDIVEIYETKSRNIYAKPSKEFQEKYQKLS